MCTNFVKESTRNRLPLQNKSCSPFSGGSPRLPSLKLSPQENYSSEQSTEFESEARARSSMCSAVWRESLHELCRKICPMIKKLSFPNPWNRKNIFFAHFFDRFVFDCSIYYLFLRKGRTELGDVTPHNIKQLKKLNSVVFPVSYNDKVRKSYVTCGSAFSSREGQIQSYLSREVYFSTFFSGLWWKCNLKTRWSCESAILFENNKVSKKLS